MPPTPTHGRQIEDEDEDDLITSAVLIACEEGNLAALEQLANVHRVSLAVSNEHGETPLHIAAGGGFEQVVAFLAGKGGKLDAPDRRGDTPLFWAARNGHTNVVHYIADKIPIVDARNKNSETALHVATRYAQVTSAIALLERGASIDVLDEHGETPLHIAAWHGYTLLLSILCRFGPTLDNVNGWSSGRPGLPFYPFPSHYILTYVNHHRHSG
uniref:ANK_REP_REGION domain-containing protein n=1 Tax=Panagrellus redivivus TaxID=6233 RepID=A0A7E4VQV6_PANRE